MDMRLQVLLCVCECEGPYNAAQTLHENTEISVEADLTSLEKGQIWMEGWKEGQTEGQGDGRMDRQTEGQMEEEADRRMNERTDRRSGSHAVRWMDR